MKNKILKTFLVLFGLFIVLFGIYVYKLRSLAVANNKIFEQRCTSVNPPLIKYKNSFLGMVDVFKNPDQHDKDDFKKLYDDYLFNVAKYIEEEDKWLETNQNYLNRWNFKLLEPWYMKQAGEYQMEMYRAYRADAQSILDVVDGKEVQPDLRLKLDKAKRDYFDFFDKASALSDWRKFISNMPVPDGCNEENMTIPDTSGSMNWADESEEEPTVPPGLEDVSG
jgi:hypothetical protein